MRVTSLCELPPAPAARGCCRGRSPSSGAHCSARTPASDARHRRRSGKACESNRSTYGPRRPTHPRGGQCRCLSGPAREISSPDGCSISQASSSARHSMGGACSPREVSSFAWRSVHPGRPSPSELPRTRRSMSATKTARAIVPTTLTAAATCSPRMKASRAASTSAGPT